MKKKPSEPSEVAKKCIMEIKDNNLGVYPAMFVVDAALKEARREGRKIKLNSFSTKQLRTELDQRDNPIWSPSM